MSGLEDLPPDQRAALTLLICQRRRYAEVAASLQIDAQAVRDRAHAALAALAPELAQPLSAEARQRIGELLLGQLEDEDSIVAAKLQIAASDAESRWVHALTTELQLLEGASIPRLSQPTPPQPTPPQPTPPPSQQQPEPGQMPDRGRRAPEADGARTASRRGGALLLLVLAAAAAAAIILAEGGSPHRTAGASAQHESSTASKPTATSSTQTPQLEKQINLSAPAGSGSASGVALIASEEGKHAIVLSAEKLLPTNGFVYYLWLIDSTGKTQPHAYEAPSVSASGTQKGKMSAISLLPKDASAYDRIELTKEHPRTTRNGKHTPPSSPSNEVVLSAPFSV